ncbi:hypothetical protein PGQ11_010944 [Apiospora arundinis]|uniref:Uncharacterized protein n=1 Tax=Apiospora arundinis TaxID=335852 RepID=A0ABR2HZ31_9PEZI
MRTTSSLRLLPYLGLTLLLEKAAAQDVSSSSSYISPSDAAAATTSSTPPPPPPPPPATTSSQIPETVVTSVAYVTVTSYIVDPGAATPSSSLDLTVTVDSYLPESTSTQYYNGTSTSTSTIWWTPSSSSSTVWWTPSPSSSFTTSTTTWDGSNPGQGQGQSSWDSQQHSQYTSHDHGPPSPTSTTTVFALPQSTDASEYLHHVFPPTAAQPTWATGTFYTQLASALYAVDRSFAGRDDYATIVAAISQAGDADSPQVSASIAQSAWGWAAVTTNGWYQSDVPAPVKTDVAQYIDAWHNAEYSVLDDAQRAEATATGRSGGGGSSNGGKGGGGAGGGGVSSSEGASHRGRGGVRIMVGVVAGLLVGTIGLL